jgi:DNA polymerase III delta prime subunit
LEKLSEIEYRISNGTNEKLQMSSLIATFVQARQMTERIQALKGNEVTIE